MGMNEILFITMLMSSLIWGFYKLLTDKVEL